MNVLQVYFYYTRNIITSWRRLKQNWLIGLVGKVILILGLTSAGVIVWSWKILPPAVPLWYSRPWGNERLAHPAWLTVLPLASFFWFFINILLSTFVTSDYPLFTRVLFLSSLLISVLAFLTLVNILLLVT